VSSFVRVNETIVLLSRSQQEPALKQHACSAACASTTKTTRLWNHFSNWAPSGRTNEHHTCNNGGSDHNHRNRRQARDASSSACSRARTPIERCRGVPTSFWAPFPHRETRVPTASSLLCRRSCALVRTHVLKRIYLLIHLGSFESAKWKLCASVQVVCCRRLLS